MTLKRTLAIACALMGLVGSPSASTAQPAAGQGGPIPLNLAREDALKHPRSAEKWRVLAKTHHQRGEYPVAFASLRRAALLDRTWASSDAGTRLLRQYGLDARSAPPRRGGR